MKSTEVLFQDYFFITEYSGQKPHFVEDNGHAWFTDHVVDSEGMSVFLCARCGKSTGGYSPHDNIKANIENGETPFWSGATSYHTHKGFLFRGVPGRNRSGKDVDWRGDPAQGGIGWTKCEQADKPIPGVFEQLFKSPFLLRK